MKNEIIFPKVEPEEYLRTGVMAPAWADDESCGIGRRVSHWYVEFHDAPLFLDEGTVSELPVAWPDEVPGRAFVIEYPDHGVAMDYLYVDKFSRRRGIGTKLVEACISRWPDIKNITSEYFITPAGEKFCNALEQAEKREECSCPTT